jgi:hypothetical protein
MGGKGDMTKTPGSLQDLSKSLYDKAKAEPTKRFWGLYVHVCKMETLREAYEMTKKNDGAPGIDGVTFEVIEESGAESFLQQIRDELIHNTYRPMRVRKKEIPKDGGRSSRQGCESSGVRVPTPPITCIRRLAYSVRAEVTKHVQPERKSLGCPVR